jgi:Lrp/AsnC family leucine-responsive transcriptional regulator
MKLDRLDKKILNLMQKDARISNLDLAEQVGLSPSPCSRRIKALEESGLILKHVTLLNPEKLNLKLTAYIHINMDKHTPERLNNFNQAVSEMPEVMECALITGNDADYQLKVVVPDMEFYQHFLLEKLTRIEGVTGVRSSFVLQQVKHPQLHLQIRETEIEPTPITFLKHGKKSGITFQEFRLCIGIYGKMKGDVTGLTGSQKY